MSTFLEQKITETVHAYVRVAATGSGAEVASLFAPGASVEDPVGQPAHEGIDAVAAFYESVRSDGRTIELLTLRVADHIAAFHFRVTSKVDDNTTVVTEPIDVMTFDDDARITSMRAIWSENDLQMITTAD